MMAMPPQNTEFLRMMPHEIYRLIRLIEGV
jgi:hypothetical protein